MNLYTFIYTEQTNLEMPILMNICILLPTGVSVLIYTHNIFNILGICVIKGVFLAIIQLKFLPEFFVK